MPGGFEGGLPACAVYAGAVRRGEIRPLERSPGETRGSSDEVPCASSGCALPNARQRVPNVAQKPPFGSTMRISA